MWSGIYSEISDIHIHIHCLKRCMTGLMYKINLSFVSTLF